MKIYVKIKNMILFLSISVISRLKLKEYNIMRDDLIYIL